MGEAIQLAKLVEDHLAFGRRHGLVGEPSLGFCTHLMASSLILTAINCAFAHSRFPWAWTPKLTAFSNLAFNRSRASHVISLAPTSAAMGERCHYREDRCTADA